jgi:hypothetical protein
MKKREYYFIVRNVHDVKSYELDTMVRNVETKDGNVCPKMREKVFKPLGANDFLLSKRKCNSDNTETKISLDRLKSFEDVMNIVGDAHMVDYTHPRLTLIWENQIANTFEKYNEKNNQLKKIPDVILDKDGKLIDIFDLSLNKTLKGDVRQIATYDNGGFHLSTAGCRTKKYLTADVVLHPLSTHAFVTYDTENTQVLCHFAYKNWIVLDIAIPFLSEQKDEFQEFLNAKFLAIADVAPVCLMPYNADDYLSAINYFELVKCGVPCKQIMIETVIEYAQKFFSNNSKKI